MCLVYALLLLGVCGARVRDDTELVRLAEQAEALAKPSLERKKLGEPCTCGHEEKQECCEAGLWCTSESEDEPYSCKAPLGFDCEKDSECIGRNIGRKVACKGDSSAPRCCIAGTSLGTIDYKKAHLHKPWLDDSAYYCCSQNLDVVQPSPDEEGDGTWVCG